MQLCKSGIVQWYWVLPHFHNRTISKGSPKTHGVVRTYKVYGKESLEGGGEWQYPTNSLHRFFKVTVEMP